MSILVLGGAGYIGSHTARALVEAGREVVVADNLETGFRAAVPAGARFYEGDIHDRAFVDRLFENERIEGVIHFAANSQVGESMAKPLKYYDNNLCGTKTLLESMVAHGVLTIVFSSTAATYGEPERVPILENDRTEPTNCYGETKLSMEKMMKWVSAAHGLRFVALRYFNACGAQPDASIGEAHNPETHLLPLILQVPNGQREAISIFGDDYPPPNPRAGGGSPRGRPRPVDRLERKSQGRARLEAAVQRPAYHHPDRVGLAQGPPAWLRSVRRRGYDR